MQTDNEMKYCYLFASETKKKLFIQEIMKMQVYKYQSSKIE